MIVSEEKEFTMRLDGVTFWLRDLDYGGSNKAEKE